MMPLLIRFLLGSCLLIIEASLCHTADHQCSSFSCSKIVTPNDCELQHCYPRHADPSIGRILGLVSRECQCCLRCLGLKGVGEKCASLDCVPGALCEAASTDEPAAVHFDGATGDRKCVMQPALLPNGRPALVRFLEALLERAAAGDGVCSSPGWVAWGDSCYWYYRPEGDDAGVDWHTALQRCEGSGSGAATLASVHSEVEHWFIWRQLMGGDGDAWIGLSDIDNERGSSRSGWKWLSDNSPYDYRGGWRAGQPDDLYGENCVAISSHTVDESMHGTWNDNPCDATVAWIPHHTAPMGFVCKERQDAEE